MRSAWMCALLLFLSSKSITAQTWHTYVGFVRSEEDHQPVAFASVIHRQSSAQAISSENGMFSIAVLSDHSSDTLVFSLIGYEILKRHVVVPSKDNDTLDILLKPLIVPLPVADIRGRSAMEIVRSSIEKINDQFPANSFDKAFFYRQYHRENERYVRLLEAQVFVPQEKFVEGNSKVKVKICALRRSDVTETNREKHGDHLIDLLYDNPVRHNLGTVLNKKALGYYRFNFIPEKCNDSITVIHFQLRAPLKGKWERGELYINENADHIVKMVIENFIDEATYDFRFNQNTTYSWKFNHSTSTFEYDETTYDLKSAVKQYRHLLYHSRSHFLEKTVDETFELFPMGKTRASICNGDYTPTSNLYSSKYLYDKQQWIGFPVLNDAIIKDLEEDFDLESQYMRNGK